MGHGQQELIWYPKDYPSPTAEVRLNQLDPSNPKSPYYGFVGNRKAVNKLIRIDFDALGHHNRVCSELSVAFLGKSGSGKTELAKRHAKANGLPLVEISPKAVSTTHDIYKEIERVCFGAGIPLIEHLNVRHYLLPPINVFIDEVHALAKPIVQGLLKATEYSDSLLVTERNYRVNCGNVHWMIATTDRGKLFDAFDTRFMKVVLHLYTKEEIAQIVKMHHPSWDGEICGLVAHYAGRIPREALAFAREMKLEHNMHFSGSTEMGTWIKVAARVAEDNEINEQGMTQQRLAILRALKKGSVPEKRLPIVAGVKSEELEKFIMPWLLESTEDQPAYVVVTNKGYTITEAGLQTLN